MEIDVKRVNAALSKDRYIHSSEVENMLNQLQWAKEFMNNYERRRTRKVNKDDGRDG